MGDTVELLTRNADLALYRSKQTGRGKFSFYEPEMGRGSGSSAGAQI